MKHISLSYIFNLSRFYQNYLTATVTQSDRALAPHTEGGVFESQPRQT